MMRKKKTKRNAQNEKIVKKMKRIEKADHKPLEHVAKINNGTVQNENVKTVLTLEYVVE
jgi:hypothetical protein